MVSLPPAPPRPGPPATRARILDAARATLFAHGYPDLTMDALARELGMSKKTLYVHFPGKDAIAGAIIDEIERSIRERMDAILTDRRLTFTRKLAGVIDVVGSMLARASPGLLHNLQRSAPELYQKIDDIRARNVPYVFGRLIRAGQAEGKVRAELDPDFAVQFWLQAIRGLLQPALLEHTQLTPKQTLEKAVRLFFGGLLTSAGHNDYEKHIASRPSSPAF
jgi:AcrR family transcriptional regulator